MTDSTVVLVDANPPINDLSINDPNLAVNGYSMTPDATVVPDMMQQTAYPMPIIETISADEIALYDRQIRLWGVQAQTKIRNANILLAGIKAFGNEVAKNLVLAGVGSLTILDHENVTAEDLGSQFLLTEESVGKNRAEEAKKELQKLNSRVNINIDTDMVTLKPPGYFALFDITIALGLPFDVASNVDVACRMSNRKFYAGDTYGMYGYIFADLCMHTFVVERDQSNIPAKVGQMETTTRTIIDVNTKKENGKNIEVLTKQEIYSPLLLANSSPLPKEAVKNLRTRRKITPLLSCVRALFDFHKETGGRTPGHNRPDLEHFTRLAHEKHLELQLPSETLKAEFLRKFIANLGSEISPVVAVLGGHLAQDVINVLGQQQQPLQNLFLFDGDEFQAPVYSMHPIFDDDLSVVNVPMNGVSDASTSALLNETAVVV